MNASYVVVSSYILSQRIEATLKTIDISREQARRAYIAEKLASLRNSWWNSMRRNPKPVPGFDTLWADETKASLTDPYHAFHHIAQKHGAQVRKLVLMLKACELRNEVVLTLDDLRYLDEPMEGPGIPGSTGPR